VRERQREIGGDKREEHRPLLISLSRGLTLFAKEFLPEVSFVNHEKEISPKTGRADKKRDRDRYGE
jgi:hypothetical protein